MDENEKMMDYTTVYEKLWELYSNENPSVKKIHQLFNDHGENVENDHIAFRTFNDPRVNIDKIAKPFENIGYRKIDEYHFEKKKLRAVHYENDKIKDSPKVFISELKLEEFSDFIKNTVCDLLDRVSADVYNSDDLIFKGRLWNKISHSTYERMRAESEYAAWLYVFGFRANHFTVNVNAFKNLNSLEKVNKFLKENGFKMNTSGGEIKGTSKMLLQQSSILADIVNIKFKEGEFKVPSCYYEFALRFKDKNGKLFNGFHADSADKIFESTDFYKD